MNRRFVAALAAVALLAACTNSKAAPPSTTRAPLRPMGTTTGTSSTTVAPSTSVPSPTFRAAPFTTSCTDQTVPFQVSGVVPGWDTVGALWTGTDAVTGAPGIVEVHQGDGLPEPTDPVAITVLGAPATIGAISDGFVVRFRTGGPPGFACAQWALVAHPQTSIDTLSNLAERLTFFGVGEITLDCNAALPDDSPVAASDEVVMNLVELPAHRALQTSREFSPQATSMLFAKNGLIVQPGVSFDLRVADEARGRVALGWDRRSAPVGVVHVPACDPPAPPATRLAFIGGFYALFPTCAVIRVVDFDVATDLQIGIGTPCPGQLPIEGPTET